MFFEFSQFYEISEIFKVFCNVSETDFVIVKKGK